MAWKVKISVLREGVSYLRDEFEHSPITLGALPKCDLVLNDPFVSGQHAVVKVSRGQMVFSDLSRNGSFINGQRIREHDLGRQATVDIPPFSLELVFEIDNSTRQTMFRGDRSALEEARRELEEQEQHAQTPVESGAPWRQTPARGLQSNAVSSPTPVPQWSDPATAMSEDGTGISQQGTLKLEPEESFEPGAMMQDAYVPDLPVPGASPLPSGAPSPSDIQGAYSGESVGSTGPASEELSPAVPSLEIAHGLDELHGLVLALGNEMTLGRADTADLWIPIETVSRSHAVIRVQPNGGYMIEDLGSANGTFVNGERIATRDLKAGDEILIGEVLLRFIGESSATTMRIQVEEAIAEPVAPAKPDGIPDEQSSVAPEKAQVESELTALSFHRQALSPDGAKFLVTAQGRVDGYNYAQLGDSLDSTIDEGGRHLVLDLSSVEYIGHTGLGVLVRCQSRLRRLRGELRLVGPNERIRDALALTRLDSLFHGLIYADQNDALRDIA